MTDRAGARTLRWAKLALGWAIAARASLCIAVDASGQVLLAH